MVRQWQSFVYKKRYSDTSRGVSPGFVERAGSFGAKGLRVEKTKDVKGPIAEALKIPRPVFVDCGLEPEEDVYAMVLAGAPINNMLLVVGSDL